MLRRAKAFLLVLGAAIAFGGSDSGISFRAATNSSSKRGAYRVKVKFPVLYAKEPAAKPIVDMANRTIKLEVESQRATFVQEYLKSSRPAGQPEYEMTLDFETGVLRSRLVSTLLSTYQYTGGAHGNTFYAHLNFGLVGGKPVRLKLAHLFRTKFAPLPVVSKLVMDRLAKRPEAAWVQEGEVKELTAKQAEQFRVTAKGLEFVFAPYEMGPYSSGPIRCRLSWADLKPHLDPNGVLKGML